MIPDYGVLKKHLTEIARYWLAKRWVRFGVIGCAATLSYFLLGLLFVNCLHFPLLAGNALAYAASFILSYLGQAFWTFNAQGTHKNMLPKYAFTQAIGLIINSCIIKTCAYFGLRYEISMVAAIIIVPFIVYLVCKYWVFAKKPG